MAIQAEWEIFFDLVGDGVATVFKLDLMKDPYYVIQGMSDVSGQPLNWFSIPGGGGYRKPVGIGFVQELGSGPSFTATLSGTVITITFSSAPANNVTTGVGITLLFASE